MKAISAACLQFRRNIAQWELSPAAKEFWLSLLCFFIGAAGMYIALIVLFLNGLHEVIIYPNSREMILGFIKIIMTGPTALISGLPLVKFFQG